MLAHPHFAAILLDEIEEPLALFDSGDRLVCCNRAYLALVGAADDGTVLGRKALDLLEAWLPELALEGDAERERLLRWHALVPAQPCAFFEVRSKDGRRLRVTDRRTSEQGRSRTVWDVTGTTDPVALALVSSLGRKLMTPLNALLGFAQLMQADRRDPLAPRHRARLERILQGGDQLARSIDGLMEFTELEVRAGTLSLESVDAEAVVKEVLGALERPASEAHVSLWLETPPDGLPAVLVALRPFSEVLMKFGRNAVTHSRPNGAVRFIIAFASPHRVRVSVHDNGNGIPAERQAMLLRVPLYGAEAGAKQTGTGLNVAKRLAELMGGAVGFRSRPGAGSEFWVEVPVA